MRTHDPWYALLDEIRAGRPAVLATVVRASGSTPRGGGAKMLFRADGTTVGTIGGGAFEAMVGADATDLLSGTGDGATLKRYTFTEHGEQALGMACGGNAEVFLERIGRPERLVIFGAGHVGLALARLASGVGFQVELVDDRREACVAAERSGAGRVFHCDERYETGLPQLDPQCYVAVVTRCHRTDRLALRYALGQQLRYVGLIGSRRKRQVVLDDLAAVVPEERLARLRCPIGLPLGGDTPAEIAVSIVAELLQERHRAFA